MVSVPSAIASLLGQGSADDGCPRTCCRDSVFQTAKCGGFDLCTMFCLGQR